MPPVKLFYGKPGKLSKLYLAGLTRAYVTKTDVNYSGVTENIVTKNIHEYEVGNENLEWSTL